LMSAVDDSPERDEMVRRGLERARSCSWPEVAAAYQGLYERALRPSANSARGVEVVVVAYGRPDLLAAAVEPLRSLPVTVVDNSSSPEVAAVCDALAVRYLD